MKRVDNRCYFFQWELDQRIVVEENCEVVQFGNGTMTNALGVEVYEENGIRYADVPNILLQVAADLHAYAWNEFTKSVVAHNVFGVEPMPKPAQYAYTQTEVKQYDKLLAALEANAAYYLPEVDAEGNLIWKKGMEQLPDVPSANIRGPQGVPGPPGPQGAPGIVNIDDDTIGTDAWSSKRIIDQMCPAFVKSGTSVTCEPVEGYPLEVISAFLPSQSDAGGEPSPENAVPIEGIASLWLSIGETDGKGIEFGDTIYGGTYNWGTGVLTVEWVKKIITGGFQDGTNTQMARALSPAPSYDPAVSTVFCSQYRGYGWTELWQIQVGADTQGVAARPDVLLLIDNVNFAGDAAALNAHLAENPMELVYKLAEPYTLQFDPQQIYAAAGENTLAVDHGTITITGRTLPDNGSTVELDTTLTIEGKAADAKAVGDAIGDIETALDAIIEIQNELIGGDA